MQKDVELAAVGTPGFVDPFDELAARPCTAGSGATPPQQHPQASFHDPLDALWRDPLTDPQGAAADDSPTTSRPAPPNASLSHFWDFELSPPSATASPGPGDAPPHTQQHQQQRGAAGVGSSSTGDLLDLGPASGPGRADGPGSRACGQGLHGLHANGTRSTGDLAAAAAAGGSGAAGGARRSSTPTPGGSTGSFGRAGSGAGAGPTSSSAGAGEGGGSDGQAAKPESRELYIYAIPLLKERLVFLPITGWQEGGEAGGGEEGGPGGDGGAAAAAPSGVLGSLSAGVSRLGARVAGVWASMGTKDPGTLQHKIYEHGTRVIENQSAEERLMRAIPKTKPTKVVVYHPLSVLPSEVQEQLTKMSSQYVVKSAGKAAAAGLLLPVAVGVEIVAVPGTGWYMLYQLYKATTSASGGQRLHKYLAEGSDTRVCYAGDARLDKYCERARHSPDGLLGGDDIDDLCHELAQPGLCHPLTELRSRYLKRIQQKTGDYALLPASDAAGDGDAFGAEPPPKPKTWPATLWGRK